MASLLDFHKSVGIYVRAHKSGAPQHRTLLNALSMNFHFMSEYEKAFVPRVIKELVLNLATYHEDSVSIFEGWVQNVSENDIKRIHNLKPESPNNSIKLGAYIYTYIKDIVLWEDANEEGIFSFELRMKILTESAFTIVHSIGRAERNRKIHETVVQTASTPQGIYFGYTSIDTPSGFMILTRTETAVLDYNVSIDVLKTTV